LEGLSNLNFPWKTILSKDLSSRLERLALVKEDCSHYNLITHHCLMMVNMGCAIRAIVAVDRLA